jgi:hypothetical protein
LIVMVMVLVEVVLVKVMFSPFLKTTTLYHKMGRSQ